MCDFLRTAPGSVISPGLLISSFLSDAPGSGFSIGSKKANRTETEHRRDQSLLQKDQDYFPSCWHKGCANSRDVKMSDDKVYHIFVTMRHNEIFHEKLLTQTKQ